MWIHYLPNLYIPFLRRKSTLLIFVKSIPIYRYFPIIAIKQQLLSPL